MPKSNHIAYYGKKILVFLLSVLVLSIVVFYVARLAPGDPLVSYYGERTEKMSPKEREWALKKLGLNEPIHVQYIKWLGRIRRVTAKIRINTMDSQNSGIQLDTDSDAEEWKENSPGHFVLKRQEGGKKSAKE